ncbi:MAG: NUDIX domain-containing protein, partial [Rhizobiales bacterium]|nr:NUDIX domain-containing protein [Hyphomicrobiales bacterium]
MQLYSKIFRIVAATLRGSDFVRAPQGDGDPLDNAILLQPPDPPHRASRRSDARDGGESESDAARRECVEETGVAPDALVRLYSVLP